MKARLSPHVGLWDALQKPTRLTIRGPVKVTGDNEGLHYRIEVTVHMLHGASDSPNYLAETNGTKAYEMRFDVRERTWADRTAVTHKRGKPGRAHGHRHS